MKYDKCLTTGILAILLAVVVQGARADEGAEASLYERLGGLAPITVVVSDFIDVMVPDPQLNENPAIDASRETVPAPYLKYQVTAMVCEATGGPCQYHGRTMEKSHAHLNISGEEWQRMLTLLKGVLDKHQVPEKERKELLAIVGSTRDDIVTATNAGTGEAR